MMTPEQRPSASLSGTRRMRSVGGEEAREWRKVVASERAEGETGHSGWEADKRATWMSAVGAGVGEGERLVGLEVEGPATLARLEVVLVLMVAEEEDEARLDIVREDDGECKDGSKKRGGSLIGGSRCRLNRIGRKDMPCLRTGALSELVPQSSRRSGTRPC